MDSTQVRRRRVLGGTVAITELEQLQSSTLLARTGLLVAATDADGRMALLSPGLQQLFEVPFEPLSEGDFTHRFQLLTHDGGSPLPVEDIPLVRARRGEVVRDALVVARTPAGRLIYLRCSASPLKDPEGRITGAIVLVQDVTGERAALERQADLRDRLLETINHHLRTPVTSLLGNAELLDDHKDEMPAQSHRAVNAVLRSACELAALLETVSALVDLDRHTQIVKIHGDLSVALRQVVRTLRPLFDKRQVSVRVDLSGPLLVVADFAEVRRAVAELLDNAARYAPGGSEVELHARCDDDGVEVTIADHGPGIPDREQTRLLQPFERGSHPRQEVTGKGLGLAIANTIVAAHGGVLELRPRHPHGLCVTMRLPNG